MSVQELDRQWKMLYLFDKCTCWEVQWSLDVSDSVFHDVWKESWKGQWTFVSNDENFVWTSIGFNCGFDLSDDTWVDTTAKTFIWGDWDEKPFFRSECLLLLLKESLAVNDFLDGSNTEEFSFFESSDVLLHFRCSDHLHSLRIVSIYTLVIFLIDSTAFILNLMAFKFFVAKLNWVWFRRLDVVWILLNSI